MTVKSNFFTFRLFYYTIMHISPFLKLKMVLLCCWHCGLRIKYNQIMLRSTSKLRLIFCLEQNVCEAQWWQSSLSVISVSLSVWLIFLSFSHFLWLTKLTLVWHAHEMDKLHNWGLVFITHWYLFWVFEYQVIQ